MMPEQDYHKPLYTYAGNIHIHSLYSDGSGDFKQIAAAAAANALSYVIVTDHETMEGRSLEGYYGQVALLVGVEINRPHSHYLALGLKQTVAPDPENPQAVIDQVREAGGLGFIAHPFEKGSLYIEKGKAYPWCHWPVFGFTGIEIWNYTSQWRGRHSSLLRAIYYFFLDRKGAMDSPPPEILQLWDCYNKAGYRVVGIGGSDAHAFIFRLGFLSLEIFSYSHTFSAINTHLLLEEELAKDFLAAKAQILSAINDGRCYISFDSLAAGSDFTFYALSRRQRYLMGSTLTFAPGIILEGGIPVKRAFFRLVRDGRVIYTCSGKELRYPVLQPGIYRLEVFHQPLFGRARPWIYSNPIFVNKGQ